VEHVQPFDRPFPWRAAVLAAFAVVVVGAVALVVVRAGRLVHAHRAAARATTTAAKRRATPSRPLRPRSGISVLVLNGNGASGVAGATASRLLGRGYRSASATNAPNADYATSLVLYRPGWAPEARRLAREAGIRVVSPLDGRLPAGSGRDQIVLILGAN
jgi:pyruvate/2-oxoglutarate dehydrogenase complex dihydrolipoamide acyltransferase (E2) component